MSNTELPAFVAELESLEAKATPGPWDIGISYISNKADIYVDSSESIRIDESVNSIADSRFVATLRNHAPALLTLVRQLQGERDHATRRWHETEAELQYVLGNTTGVNPIKRSWEND